MSSLRFFNWRLLTQKQIVAAHISAFYMAANDKKDFKQNNTRQIAFYS
jgi:hypothetical protein